MDQPPDNSAVETPPAVVARPILRYARAFRRSRSLELPGVSPGAAALDLLLILFVALAAPISLELLAAVINPQSVAGGFDWTLVPRKWVEALLVVTLLVLLVHRHALTAAAFGWRSSRLGHQLAWSLPALFGGYVAIVLIGLFLMPLSASEEDVAQRVEFLDLLPLDSFRTTVLLLVAVAVHEELLFRGLLIPLLRRIGLGWIGAVLVSTAIFAVLHVAQGWMAIVQVFGLGLVFGTVFVLSRSVLAVIVAHFAFDLLQFQVARVLLPLLEEYSNST